MGTVSTTPMFKFFTCTLSVMDHITLFKTLQLSWDRFPHLSRDIAWLTFLGVKKRTLHHIFFSVETLNFIPKHTRLYTVNLHYSYLGVKKRTFHYIFFSVETLNFIPKHTRLYTVNLHYSYSDLKRTPKTCYVLVLQFRNQCELTFGDWICTQYAR